VRSAAQDVPPPPLFPLRGGGGGGGGGGSSGKRPRVAAPQGGCPRGDRVLLCWSTELPEEQPPAAAAAFFRRIRVPSLST